MKCCFHEKKNNKVNSGDYNYNITTKKPQSIFNDDINILVFIEKIYKKKTGKFPIPD